jgi:hypothetical protein
MTKKTARKKTAAKNIELRPIRRSLTSHKRAIEQTLKARQREAQKTGTRLGSRQRELETALRSMNRMLGDIQSICGSNMSIPLA